MKFFLCVVVIVVFALIARMSWDAYFAPPECEDWTTHVVKRFQDCKEYREFKPQHYPYQRYMCCLRTESDIPHHSIHNLQSI